MTMVRGPLLEDGFAWFHGHEQPLPEFPALTHVNEARCTADHVLPPHSHPAWELCWFVSGRARWTCNGEDVDLGPGDIHIARPGELHSGRPDPRDPNHNLAIGFDPRLLPLPTANPALAGAGHDVASAVAEADLAVNAFGLAGQRVVRGSPRVGEICRRVLAELDGMESDPLRRRLTVAMIQALLVELAVVVTRCALDGATVLPDSSPRRDDLRALLVWIASRLDQPPTVDEMAARIGLSPSHLTVIFREELGRTPIEHLTEMRLDAACRLLADTRRSVTDVALELGFCSSQWFATVFRRHRGASPTAWRRGTRV